MDFQSKSVAAVIEDIKSKEEMEERCNKEFTATLQQMKLVYEKSEALGEKLDAAEHRTTESQITLATIHDEIRFRGSEKELIEKTRFDLNVETDRMEEDLEVQISELWKVKRTYVARLREATETIQSGTVESPEELNELRQLLDGTLGLQIPSCPAPLFVADEEEEAQMLEILDRIEQQNELQKEINAFVKKIPPSNNHGQNQSTYQKKNVFQPLKNQPLRSTTTWDHQNSPDDFEDMEYESTVIQVKDCGQSQVVTGQHSLDQNYQGTGKWVQNRAEVSVAQHREWENKFQNKPPDKAEEDRNWMQEARKQDELSSSQQRRANNEWKNQRDAYTSFHAPPKSSTLGDTNSSRYQQSLSPIKQKANWQTGGTSFSRPNQQNSHPSPSLQTSQQYNYSQSQTIRGGFQPRSRVSDFNNATVDREDSHVRDEVPAQKPRSSFVPKQPSRYYRPVPS